MASFQKTILIGHLGKDPETRTVGDNTVTNFSVAITKRKKDEQITDWYNVSAWNKLGEIAQKFLKKGDAVYLEGELSVRQYDDKEGNARFSLELSANALTMLGTKSQSSGEKSETPTQPDVPAIPENEENLPF